MTRIVCFMAGLAIIATSGTANADIAWTAGAPNGTTGGAIDFDQFASLSPLLDTGIASNDIYGTGGTGTGDYTVSAWLNPDTTNELYFLGTQNEALHLGTQGGTLRTGHWGSDHSASTAIVANEWIHATYAYEAGVATIYLNGVADGSLARNAPNNTNTNLVIGGRIRNATEDGVLTGSGNSQTGIPVPAGSGLNRNPWDGQIDDLAIFDSALSAAQISDLFSGAQDPLALGANAYYDFEDDQFGTTAAVQGTLGVAVGGITANAVPEPSSIALLVGFGVAGLARRKRS